MKKEIKIDHNGKMILKIALLSVTIILIQIVISMIFEA
jgi:hypothetical protein